MDSKQLRVLAKELVDMIDYDRSCQTHGMIADPKYGTVEEKADALRTALLEGVRPDSEDFGDRESEQKASEVPNLERASEIVHTWKAACKEGEDAWNHVDLCERIAAVMSPSPTPVSDGWVSDEGWGPAAQRVIEEAIKYRQRYRATDGKQFVPTDDAKALVEVVDVLIATPPIGGEGR